MFFSFNALLKLFVIILNDKNFLFRRWSIGGVVLACQEIFCIYIYIEKQGPAMRLGKKGGATVALFRNQHHLFPFEVKRFL
jgi:hypothetical protein